MMSIHHNPKEWSPKSTWLNKSQKVVVCVAVGVAIVAAATVVAAKAHNTVAQSNSRRSHIQQPTCKQLTGFPIQSTFRVNT